ncbi:baseplate assembly protein [Sphingobium abikonense]|uniref:baseplate assembly protein n=1 Tax=Sphingobium abikonense TaxID=86193 RepID=UPI000789294A|nr:baseplate J/gp47 family protein [Sphingobium abikonense]
MADAPYTAVDLSRLLAPDIIEPLDFETILSGAVARMKDEMAASGLTFESRDSDPATKLLQTFSYFVQLLRQRINDAARAVMPAYATGADLDNIAAAFGIARLVITPADAATGAPAVLESDDDFRRRMVLAPEGYSVAGPEGAYISHALSADADVLDASATSPAPGEVLVAILSRTGDGGASPALVDKVAAYLSADTRRPLTDYVTVQSAQLVEYAVDYDLTTYNGPDGGVVFAASKAAVDAYVAQSRRLGMDITRSAIFAAAHVAGVQNIILRSPPADIAISRTQAPVCTGVTARHLGTGE